MLRHCVSVLLLLVMQSPVAVATAAVQESSWGHIKTLYAQDPAGAPNLTPVEEAQAALDQVPAVAGVTIRRLMKCYGSDHTIQIMAMGSKGVGESLRPVVVWMTRNYTIVGVYSCSVTCGNEKAVDLLTGEYLPVTTDELIRLSTDLVDGTPPPDDQQAPTPPAVATGYFGLLDTSNGSNNLEREARCGAIANAATIIAAWAMPGEILVKAAAGGLAYYLVYMACMNDSPPRPMDPERITGSPFRLNAISTKWK